MEEQFANFLSDELLEFSYYDSHENNLVPSASSCIELDAALTYHANKARSQRSFCTAQQRLQC